MKEVITKVFVIDISVKKLKGFEMKRLIYVVLCCYSSIAFSNQERSCSEMLPEISENVSDMTMLLSKGLNNDVISQIKECMENAQSLSIKERSKYKEALSNALTNLKTLMVQKNIEIRVIDAGGKKQTEETKKQKKDLEKQVKTLEETMKASAKAERKFKFELPENIGWYDPYYFNIYAGVEGTTVSGIEKKDNTRISLSAYYQFSPIDKIDKKRTYFFAPHLFGQYSETTLGEQNSDASTEALTSTELDIGVFLPVYRTPRSKVGYGILGLIYGNNYTSDESITDYEKKEYSGLRFAYSHNMYVDVLETGYEGNSIKRNELRYQAPIGSIGDGAVLLGFIFNQGSDTTYKDSKKIYVVWDYPLNK